MAALSVHAKEYSEILFIGNSITLVGSQETGFGLAASSAEKDYVHELLSMIGSKQGYLPGKRAYNVSNFEENFFKIDLPEYVSFTDGYDPDLIVLELGDNVNADSAINYNFQKYYIEFIALLGRKHPDSEIVAVTKFWSNATVDTMIINAVNFLFGAGYHIRYADISSLSGNPENHALSERSFENYGDGSHPGDRGMLHIAEIIFSVLYGNSAIEAENARRLDDEPNRINAFPNPFNGATLIEFNAGNDGRTTVIVYDILGRKTATLFDENARSGENHRIFFNAGNLPSGEYLCILKNGGSSGYKRISIIR